MKGLRCTLAVLLWAVVFAVPGATQSLTDVLSSTPPCASGNCDITDVPSLPSCACTNTTLQAAISACVQKSCALLEQAQAATVTSAFCADFPKESRRGEVRATAIACLALTLVIVLLRCVSRFTVSSRLWWDDWTTLAATVFLGGTTGINIAVADFGFGLHYWDVDPTKGATILQMFWTAQMFYILVQVTAKASILILFWRIFTARWFRITVWGGGIFLVTHGLLFLLLIVFQCLPVRAIWDKSLDAKCLNITAVGLAGAAFSIFEDIAILLMPIPEVRKLQLTLKKRVAVCLMFGIGSFACVTSMVRLKYMVSFANSSDPTWENVDIVIWSIIEVTCAIICGSLPTLRPLLQKVPGLLSSGRTSSSLYGGGAFSNTAATNERGSQRRSAHPVPGDFNKLPDDHWGPPGRSTAAADYAPKRAAHVGVSRDSVSLDEFEMAVIAREKSGV
ncbi:uncharacterized protein VDAG_00617 [Verticillium dahliae VdLs.17]|uniref:Integral membrane protein n=1 Tax=Verticillium dahliae (strain VdLs.17 / ATCC MYA-4575 / FGSC 10137) TaxID=498257 RepID=G2WQH5_VERDV|nr:uncharacterized protein VDAG_00617 [Verticillium dahliae VdLs.17]EGY13935.1 integral membrane protein [Verticillium dahliae VdLs.17]